ncbi:MAG: hypothetical protein V3V74_07405 [Nitrosomonadaceae bacterium]
MLKDILSNIVIYDHLCHKIVKEANALSRDLDYQDKSQLERIVSDSKRAQRLRAELLQQTTNLKVKPQSKCLNCEQESVKLKTVNLTPTKKATVCEPCYRNMVNGYVGTRFN